jgi:hypothetical protein
MEGIYAKDRKVSDGMVFAVFPFGGGGCPHSTPLTHGDIV